MNSINNQKESDSSVEHDLETMTKTIFGKSRQEIPDSVSAEMLSKIRVALMSLSNDKQST